MKNKIKISLILYSFSWLPMIYFCAYGRQLGEPYNLIIASIFFFICLLASLSFFLIINKFDLLETRDELEYKISKEKKYLRSLWNLTKKLNKEKDKLNKENEIKQWSNQKTKK